MEMVGRKLGVAKLKRGICPQSHSLLVLAMLVDAEYLVGVSVTVLTKWLETLGDIAQNRSQWRR
ncbi:unnamed protein product, partial [Schistosoma mattheei]